MAEGVRALLVYKKLYPNDTLCDALFNTLAHKYPADCAFLPPLSPTCLLLISALVVTLLMSSFDGKSAHDVLQREATTTYDVGRDEHGQLARRYAREITFALQMRDSAMVGIVRRLEVLTPLLFAFSSSFLPHPSSQHQRAITAHLEKTAALPVNESLMDMFNQLRFSTVSHHPTAAPPTAAPPAPPTAAPGNNPGRRRSMLAMLGL